LRQLVEVIRIDVPSLRQRREDVPLLAERYMRDLSREYGREAKRLAPETLQALQCHAWPGNVRELRNLTERLLLFVEADTIRVRDLPRELGGSAPPRTEDLYREFDSLAEGLEVFTRYYIRRVVAQEGQAARSAKRLGISETELAKRLAEL